MIKVEINNRQKLIKVDKNLFNIFKSVAQKTAEFEGYNNGDISIALVDNKEIRQLNNKYRNRDEVTDVLSFPMDDEIWGDIIISVERAASQAREYGHSIEREIAYLTVHGILHLLGYDHLTPGEKNEMRQKEERVLSELNLYRD